MKSAVKKVVKPSAPTRRGLGKGLSALMSEAYSQPQGPREEKIAARKEIRQEGREEPRQSLPLAQIEPGRFQPRDHFDETAMAELANSIRKSGVMQPILVRPKADGQYEIIAGERRFRAAGMAGLTEIPVLIRALEDGEALEFALIENVQRENLHPLEEAGGYQRLMDEFKYTQEQIAGTVAKSRSHVANFLRLLDLPKDVRSLFAENRISMGHARALLGSEMAGILAQEVIEKGLSVRQTEKLVRSNNMLRFPDAVRKTRSKAVQSGAEGAAATVPQYGRPKDPDIMALEETLSENLGLKVSISDRGQSGEITIAYESLEQLDEILRRLGGSI